MKPFSLLLPETARSLRDVALGTVLTGGGPILARPRRWPWFAAPSLHTALAGRSVLITGASSGIGEAVARRAASAGASVILVARSAAKLRELAVEIERAGGRARVYAADLSSGESTRDLLAALSRDGVVVDVLINNAGRSIRRSVSESRERVHDYERTMALNYFGALRLILALLPEMRARGRGHIINVSSAGVQMSTPLFSAYVASKAALDAFTRVAASEARGDGVRFATVYMPLVRTAMIAPTAAFARMPALSPEQAAELVLRPLVTHEAVLGTWIATLFSLAQIAAPAAVSRALGFGDRLLAAGDGAAPQVGATLDRRGGWDGRSTWVQARVDRMRACAAALQL